jgi:hypothetical protein
VLCMVSEILHRVRECVESLRIDGLSQMSILAGRGCTCLLTLLEYQLERARTLDLGQDTPELIDLFAYHRFLGFIPYQHLEQGDVPAIIKAREGCFECVEKVFEGFVQGAVESQCQLSYELRTRQTH